MSPLFMEGYDPNSPGSLSTEEHLSNIPGSEREGESQLMTNKQRKRQEKNRDAARKSRRKQTERADELHERVPQGNFEEASPPSTILTENMELQCLERSNSALQKEIALLKRDLHLYTTALDHHKPFCCLTVSKYCYSSTTLLSVSPAADCQRGSSVPGVPPQGSRSTEAAASSLSTSLATSLGLQILDHTANTHVSSSTSARTSSLASSVDSSSELFTSSSSLTVPCSVSAVPAPHSLFSDDPPSLITPTKASLVCTSFVSNPVSSISLPKAAQPQSDQGAVHEGSLLSANACFSTLNHDSLDAFRMKQTCALSNAVAPHSHLVPENVGLVVQSCPMDGPQLHPRHFRGNSVNSSLQGPALQSLSVSPRADPDLFHASPFSSKPNPSGHVTHNPASLLSLLTTPSPVSVAQTTSNSADGPHSQPLSSLPLLGDSSRDVSLSELLEGNDWILQ